MKYPLLFLFLLTFRVLPAQNGKIDSLQRVFRQHQQDTTGVQTLIALAGEYYLSDPAKAESVCRQASMLSAEINYPDGISASSGWLAFLFEQRGVIDSALLYYNRALAVDIQTKNKKEQGQVLNNIAAIYKDQGKTAEALSYYQQSIALAQETHSPQSMTAPLNNIGLLYQHQGQLQLALVYYERSLAIEDSLKNKEGVATSLYNIASVHKDLGEYDDALSYVNKSLKAEIELDDKYQVAYSTNFIGTIYQQQGKDNEALAKFREALLIREGIDDQQGMAYSLRNIGAIYEKLDSLPKALECYRRSLAIFRAQENSWGECTVLCKMGNLFLASGKTDSAFVYGSRSLELAKALGYPIDIRNAADLLQKVYRKQGKMTEALAMYDLFTQMRDSVQNDESHKAAMRSKYQYEYEQKAAILKADQEKQNALNEERVKREKLLRNVFIGGSVLLLLLAALLYSRYRIKNKSNRELEQKNRIISDERDRSDKLLLNILPAEVAAELKADGAARARSYDNVTVMFSDFKDFTRISEQLTPEQLVAEIDYCFSEFDRIIGKYNIEKIKTIGDAYMCVSGLPAANPDHGVTMVNAALEIRDFMVRYAKEREAQGKNAFHIRIGINSGPVVAGIVGVKKFAYDIWGDTVNLAARMEANGEMGKVNVSSGTFAIVKDDFRCEYRGKIEAKNKGMIDMYFVESV